MKPAMIVCGLLISNIALAQGDKIWILNDSEIMARLSVERPKDFETIKEVVDLVRNGACSSAAITAKVQKSLKIDDLFCGTLNTSYPPSYELSIRIDGRRYRIIAPLTDSAEELKRVKRPN